MLAKLLSVSCYLRGKREYMMLASSFGMTKPQELYAEYVAQGCWTRCLQCQKEASAPFQETTETGSERCRPALSHGLACRVCSASISNKPWLAALECNTHGCSACLNILPADHWSTKVLEKHKQASLQRKLICQTCVDQGFASNNLTRHTCEVCERELGFYARIKQCLTKHTKECTKPERIEVDLQGHGFGF